MCPGGVARAFRFMSQQLLRDIAVGAVSLIRRGGTAGAILRFPHGGDVQLGCQVVCVSAVPHMIHNWNIMLLVNAILSQRSIFKTTQRKSGLDTLYVSWY